MSINFKEFEDILVAALRDSNLIEKFSFSEINKTPDLSHVIKIFEEVHPIDFDDEGLLEKRCKYKR